MSPGLRLALGGTPQRQGALTRLVSCRWLSEAPSVSAWQFLPARGPG